jgi:hypothetical protein
VITEYQKRVTKMLDIHEKRSSDIIRKFFNLFKTTREYKDPTVPRLLADLNRQIMERNELYPRPPRRVRFDRNELKNLLKASKEFIKVVKYVNNGLEISGLKKYEQLRVVCILDTGRRLHWTDQSDVEKCFRNRSHLRAFGGAGLKNCSGILIFY